MPSLAKDLAKSVWFLDYDGTLCPHLEVWEELIYRPEDIYSTVSFLARRSAGVFWNTGRRVESLGAVNDKFLEFPGYFVQGSVFYNASTQASETIGAQLPAAVVENLQSRLATEKLYRLEIKPTSARLAPLRKTQKKYIRKFVESLGITLPDAWEWRVGDRGAEILHKQFSKGSAMAEAWNQQRVAPDAVPVVAGDDYFDRAAMEFALSRGGYVVLIGEGCGWITEIPHKSSQVIYFREPRDFLMFLKGL